jgi:2-amino-4-hydroxy-6-hydroxymethyldihydropteridine diphosphokinase
MTRAFVGLGSNRGERRAHLRRALAGLNAIPDTCLLRVSSLFESDAMGGPGEPLYLNAVAEVGTDLAPERLLEELLGLEGELGRPARDRSGARTVDLDLLYHGEARRSTARLRLPHPGSTERLFVLVPMVEIAPGWQDPRTGLRMDALLRERKHLESVRYRGRFEPWETCEASSSSSSKV